jgi:hypothetical protein
MNTTAKNKNKIVLFEFLKMQATEVYYSKWLGD